MGLLSQHRGTAPTKTPSAPLIHFAQIQTIPEGYSLVETLPHDSDTPMCFSLIDFILFFFQSISALLLMTIN